MNKRENLLWQIILIVALFAIVYNGYVLYNMNAKSVKLWRSFEKEEIGTDKETGKSAGERFANLSVMTVQP